MHLLPPKELGRLLQAMQTAANQANTQTKVWELDHGIRITCQDCELHFESFAGSELIHKSTPYGHPPQPFQCIVSRALLAKLCKAIAQSGVGAIALTGSDQGITLTSPEASFCYTLTAAKNPENFPVNRLLLTGIPINIGIYQATGESAMITVTQNYFQDLTAAIEAGAIVKRGKNPSKADLYAAIAAYNEQFASEPVDMDASVQADTPAPAIAELEAAGDEAAVSAALLAMDAVEDAKPKAVKVKAPSKLDRLVQAMSEGVTDIDQLAALSGMKPQGVKGWVGVIQNRGLENWKAACKKSA